MFNQCMNVEYQRSYQRCQSRLVCDKSHNGAITAGKYLFSRNTVTACSHIHQHVSAGDPDKQHSHIGDWWSVDNSVPSERSQTPCSRAPMSPSACCWRLQHWHTHLLPPLYESRQQRYRADRNSHALMLSEDVFKKVMLRNTLMVSAQAFRAFQLVTGGFKKSLSRPVVSGESQRAMEYKTLLPRSAHPWSNHPKVTLRAGLGLWTGPFILTAC